MASSPEFKQKQQQQSTVVVVVVVVAADTLLMFEGREKLGPKLTASADFRELSTPPLDS